MYYSYNDKGSSLKTGQYLAVNDGLTSPDGKNLLILGSDGNLVLSQLPGGTLWQSNTSGVSGQYFAIMQADGNFCIYQGSDPAHQGPFIWGTMASYRPGTGQYLALLQDNGNFTIYTQDAGQTKTGDALWSTDTAPWPRKWRPENWMGHLPGSKLLSQLTIPGTHDSGTYTGAGGVLAQCQSMSITEQLAAGIRKLDSRCRQVNNYFEIYHGIADQNVTFDVVYTACIQFLQANPGECIIMGIQPEGDPITPQGSFEDVFNRYQRMYPNFWYLGDAIPTLDEVRGKIVLMRNFATVSPPKGIDVTGGTLNATFALQRSSTVPRQSTYTMHVQGNYLVNYLTDIESHCTTVDNFLVTAATATDDDWYINGASGACDFDHFNQGVNPKLVALGYSAPLGEIIGANAHIAATLSNYAPAPFVRFGTVEMDFPDVGLIRQLIDLNAYSCLSIGGYDLRDSSDQAFAFDYDHSGKLDHLVLYRPGKGIIYMVNQEQF
jgi:Phosphatidylinositol-specific phospholipase C, X domain